SVPKGADLYFEAQLHLADCLSSAGEHAKSKELIQKVLVERPDDVFVSAAYARALERSGKVPAAEQFLSQRLLTQPASELYQALAQTYQRHGKPSEAISLLTSALAKRPGD